MSLSQESMRIALWNLPETDGWYLDQVERYIRDSVPTGLEIVREDMPSPESALILIAGSIPRPAKNPNIDAMMDLIHSTGFSSERTFLQGTWDTDYEWERIKAMVAEGAIAGYINFGCGGVGVHLAPALAGIPTMALGPMGYYALSQDDEAKAFIRELHAAVR